MVVLNAGRSVVDTLESANDRAYGADGVYIGSWPMVAAVRSCGDGDENEEHRESDLEDEEEVKGKGP